jgi:hypothetical protein
MRACEVLDQGFDRGPASSAVRPAPDLGSYRRVAFSELTEPEWRATLDTNLTALDPARGW